MVSVLKNTRNVLTNNKMNIIISLHHVHTGMLGSGYIGKRGTRMKLRAKIQIFRMKAGKYDRCVCCGDLTPYGKATPVKNRKNYVFGCGQLCEDCYLLTQMETIEEDIRLTPNYLVQFCGEEEERSCGNR